MNSTNKTPAEQFCAALELLCRTLNPEWRADAELIDLADYGVGNLSLDNLNLNNLYLRGLYLKEEYAENLVEIEGSNLANSKIDVDVHCEQCNLFRTELQYNEPDDSKNLVENNVDRSYWVLPYDQIAVMSCSDVSGHLLAYCVSSTSNLVLVDLETKEIRVHPLSLFGPSGAMLVSLMDFDHWVVLGFDGQMIMNYKGRWQTIASRSKHAIVDMALLSEEQCVTLDASGWIRVWSMASGKSVKTFRPDNQVPVVGLAVIDSERIAVLSGNNLSVYHLATETQEASFNDRTYVTYGKRQVHCVGSSRIAVMESSGNVLIYDWQKQNLELSISTLANPGTDNNFAINKELLIVAWDNVIELWDWRENNKLAEYIAPNSGYQVYLYDHSEALIIGYDGSIRIGVMENQTLQNLWALQSPNIPLLGLGEQSVAYLFENSFMQQLGRRQDGKTGKLVVSEPVLEANIVLYQDGHPVYPYMAAEHFEMVDNRLSMENSEEFKETQFPNIVGQVNLVAKSKGPSELA